MQSAAGSEGICASTGHPAAHPSGVPSRAGVAVPQLERLENLVHDMAGGDSAALSRIYEQTVAQIFAIARGMLRCKEDAEEVVCDVYHVARPGEVHAPMIRCEMPPQSLRIA